MLKTHSDQHKQTKQLNLFPKRYNLSLIHLLKIKNKSETTLISVYYRSIIYCVTCLCGAQTFELLFYSKANKTTIDLSRLNVKL